MELTQQLNKWSALVPCANFGSKSRCRRSRGRLHSNLFPHTTLPSQTTSEFPFPKHFPPRPSFSIHLPLLFPFHFNYFPTLPLCPFGSADSSATCQLGPGCIWAIFQTLFMRHWTAYFRPKEPHICLCRCSWADHARWSPSIGPYNHPCYHFWCFAALAKINKNEFFTSKLETGKFWWRKEIWGLKSTNFVLKQFLLPFQSVLLLAWGLALTFSDL